MRTMCTLVLAFFECATSEYYWCVMWCDRSYSSNSKTEGFWLGKHWWGNIGPSLQVRIL